MFLLQQAPLVVEVIKQPEPTPDLSITYIVGMFSMAGVLLAAAAVGGLIVGVAFVLYRRMRDAAQPPENPYEHNRLRI